MAGIVFSTVDPTSLKFNPMRQRKPLSTCSDRLQRKNEFSIMTSQSALTFAYSITDVRCRGNGCRRIGLDGDDVDERRNNDDRIQLLSSRK